MKARIYKPTKSSMQSGNANSKDWIIEYDENSPKRIDPLMGWTSSSDTNQQVSLHFRSLEAAITYAKKENLEFIIQDNKVKKYVPKNYADNFLFNKKY